MWRAPSAAARLIVIAIRETGTGSGTGARGRNEEDDEWRWRTPGGGAHVFRLASDFFYFFWCAGPLGAQAAPQAAAQGAQAAGSGTVLFSRRTQKKNLTSKEY